MSEGPQVLPGTLVWFAPFYDRSGYGFGARAAVLSLHAAGVRVTVIPVGAYEPGIDDCDLDLIKSLEKTPLIPPITAVFSHVPHKIWLGLKFPEPNLRIIATTFDSSAQGNLPPADWMEVCNELDQVWLMTEEERRVFLSAGLPPEKIQIVYWPHPWLGNPSLPPAAPDSTGPDRPFRFLSIAMFQPRRRWDTLIEAYLEEFKADGNAELYLKVNYPTWHPVPGRPRQDLHDLIQSLRMKTGSKAPIIVDEELGTRMDIVRVIDSCNAYVSTDTAPTAPISEARARERFLVIPEGLGLQMPADWYSPIAVDPNARKPLTPEMLQYQPHHKEAFMPGLHVEDVRRALRHAHDMSPDYRRARTIPNAADLPGPDRTVPMTINAINAGWEYKRSLMNAAAAKPAARVIWEGSQFVSHSLALINRELCLQLIDSGYEVSIHPGNEADNIDPHSEPRFEELVKRTRKALSGRADVRVRHHWPPNFDPPPDQSRLVIVQPWEYGRLPESWVEPMSSIADELWVPTRHVLKTYISSGIPADRVHVIPHGIDVNRFHPEAVKYAVRSTKKFKFLFVGGGLWRKGIDILLDAYRAEFDSRDDVVLIVKDLPLQQFYLDQGVGKIIREWKNDPSAPEILHLQEALGPDEMPGLYTACDALVHPYRGEGFAIPVLEAMACGLPAIVTAGGATDDFCSPEHTWPIASRRREFNPKDVRLAGGAGWVLEPDMDALKSLMREVFENHKAAREKALRASEHVRRHYGWKNVAAKVAERIDALAEKPVRQKS